MPALSVLIPDTSKGPLHFHYRLRSKTPNLHYDLRSISASTTSPHLQKRLNGSASVGLSVGIVIFILLSIFFIVRSGAPCRLHRKILKESRDKTGVNTKDSDHGNDRGTRGVPLRSRGVIQTPTAARVAAVEMRRDAEARAAELPEYGAESGLPPPYYQVQAEGRENETAQSGGVVNPTAREEEVV